MRDALRKLDLMTVNREPALYLGSSRRARPLPHGVTGHVAHPIRSIETRSLPTLTRSSPCRFTFYVADPRGSIQFFAADTAATTAIQLMHRKRLMIGKFRGDARWRADESCSAPHRRCK